ncbi:MAG: tyrosine-type recombinase/integrase [Deltaproteobacteria bacterium]|nr:tyrosine-type recombinase/integrase [Deltaproteobacteria bacterium]
MIDGKTISTIQWTDERLKEIESVVKVLDQAIEDYLQWMTENKYAKSTRKEYARVFMWFKLFIKERRCLWDEIFTQEMLRQFKTSERPYPMHAVIGLSRYLFEQGKIARHLGTKDQSVNLPQIYEDYLIYHQKTFQASNRKLKHVKVVLIAFHKFLEKHRIKLRILTIEKIDVFLSEYLADYKENTCRVYRSHLRGFLRYLFHEKKLLPNNMAPFIVGAPQFSKAKPPNFLRPHELKRLFAGLKLSSAGDLRAYAMVHLAYTLGLRPCEISSIRLDDIFFKDAQLCIRIRKNDKPVRLPVPEETLKAIAAYLVGGRPKSKHRELFLTLYPPYRKLAQNTVTQHIKTCMLSVGMTYSAYCLRHTYAQNLLEAGLSIYEVKEMMGHDSIESTRKYLHVHIKLMRKVLFDETL